MPASAMHRRGVGGAAALAVMARGAGRRIGNLRENGLTAGTIVFIVATPCRRAAHYQNPSAGVPS